MWCVCPFSWCTVAPSHSFQDDPPPLPAHRRRTDEKENYYERRTGGEERDIKTVRIERAPEAERMTPTTERRVERRMTPRGDVVTTTTISTTRQADVGEVESMGRGVYRNIQIGSDGVARESTTNVNEGSALREVMRGVLEGSQPGRSTVERVETVRGRGGGEERVVEIQKREVTVGDVKKPRLEEKRERKEEVEQLLVDEEKTVFTVPILRR